MSAHKLNGFPVALDSAFNRIVRYSVAANRREIVEVIALLPHAISKDLEAELAASREAHRYDLEARRAFCFQLDGDRLHVWSWNEVEDYVEAGNLLTLVVSLEKGLSEELANEVYVRATGRNVNQPFPATRGR
jgi:hypothetical protein